MALKIFDKFAPRANPADSNYPYGSIKNESVPGAKDGTPVDAAWGNDMVGFTDALLTDAGITPSGAADTALVSQRLDAVKKVSSLQAAILLIEQWGYTYKGTFAKGFTYSQVGDAGVDADFNVWIYVGAGAPNKVVTAGTDPSVLDDDYKRVLLKPLIYNNVQQLVNSGDLPALLGEQVTTKSFHAGKSYGGAEYQVVLTNTVTPNGMDVIQSTSDPLHSIKLIVVDSVWVEQLGAVGGFATDVAAIFNYAQVQYKLVRAGIRQFLFNDTFLLDSACNIQGSLKAVIGNSTELKFESMGGKDSIKLATTLPVLNGVDLSDLRVIGDKSGGAGLAMRGLLNNSISDCQFNNLRIENHTKGLFNTYSWSHVFSNIRLQSNTQSFEIVSQSNNLVFNNLNAVTSSVASRFVNCEGCVINGFNLANQTGANALTLFQSYITVNSPYMENVPDDAILLGGSSEVNPSSLVVQGGLIGGGVRLGNSGVYLDIAGSRWPATGFTVSPAAKTVPTVFCSSVSVKGVGLAAAEVSEVYLLDRLDYTNPRFFAGASGGSIRNLTMHGDRYNFSQTAASNGITVTTSLTPNVQHTLVITARKVGSFAISVRVGGTNLGLASDVIPENTGGWVTRYMPFIPDDTNLGILFNGTLEIRDIAVYKGIKTSEDVRFSKSRRYWYNSVPTGSGFDVGDEVHNTVVSVGNPKSWIFDGTSWISTGNL